MTGGYTKLFSDILTSSIWNEDEKTRILWITMLAMCDAEGHVHSSLGSLAHMARLSMDDTKAGLKILESPDDDSRSSAHEGRRVEKVEGGWDVLNYSTHRNRLSTESKAVSARDRKRKQREREKERDVTECHVTSCDTASASADGVVSVSKDGESEGKITKRRTKKPSETDKRRIRGDVTDPLALRVGSWFGRRPTTKWTMYEAEAFMTIKPSIEEINDLELFYTYDHPAGADYRRRKLEQLLNNWASEVDKARAFIAEKNKSEKKSENEEW